MNDKGWMIQAVVDLVSIVVLAVVFGFILFMGLI